MSMRIERTIEVYLLTRQKILGNLAAGLRQTMDDIPGIVRESVQEIAERKSATARCSVFPAMRKKAIIERGGFSYVPSLRRY